MRSLSTKASQPGLKGGDASAERGELPVSGGGGGCHPTRGRHSGVLNLKSSAAAAQATSCVTFLPESPRKFLDIIQEGRRVTHK